MDVVANSVQFINRVVFGPVSGMWWLNSAIVIRGGWADLSLIFPSYHVCHVERLHLSFSELFIVLILLVVLRLIPGVFDSNCGINGVVNSPHDMNGLISSSHIVNGGVG